VESAGTDPAPRVHPRAVKVAARHGLGLDDAGTRRLEGVQRPGDLVVAVCDNAFEDLLERVRPELHWSVPDPVRRGSGADFEAAFADIRSRVARLAGAFTRPGPLTSGAVA
jgi:protein-tyrosine-phosphatase